MQRTRHERKIFGRFLERSGIAKIFRAADSPGPIGNWLGNIVWRNPARTPSIQQLPLKHIRLQELADAGFNCPDFKFWLRGELNTRALQELWEKHRSLSLRNFTEENVLAQTPKLPVAYDKSDWGFILDFCSRHNMHYHTLVHEALPLADSLIAGNIILLDAKRYVVAYFDGYGTPRDVDDKPPSELKVYLRTFDSEAPRGTPTAIETLPRHLQGFRKDFRPMTVEFSVYPYVVGIHNRPEILWEWRGGSTYDLYTVITRLLECVDAHELKICLPPMHNIPEGSRSLV